MLETDLRGIAVSLETYRLNVGRVVVEDELGGKIVVTSALGAKLEGYQRERFALDHTSCWVSLEGPCCILEDLEKHRGIARVVHLDGLVD